MKKGLTALLVAGAALGGGCKSAPQGFHTEGNGGKEFLKYSSKEGVYKDIWAIAEVGPEGRSITLYDSEGRMIKGIDSDVDGNFETTKTSGLEDLPIWDIYNRERNFRDMANEQDLERAYANLTYSEEVENCDIDFSELRDFEKLPEGLSQITLEGSMLRIISDDRIYEIEVKSGKLAYYVRTWGEWPIGEDITGAFDWKKFTNASPLSFEDLGRNSSIQPDMEWIKSTFVEREGGLYIPGGLFPKEGLIAENIRKRDIGMGPHE